MSDNAYYVIIKLLYTIIHDSMILRKSNFAILLFSLVSLSGVSFPCALKRSLPSMSLTQHSNSGSLYVVAVPKFWHKLISMIAHSFLEHSIFIFLLLSFTIFNPGFGYFKIIGVLFDAYCSNSKAFCCH